MHILLLEILEENSMSLGWVSDPRAGIYFCSLVPSIVVKSIACSFAGNLKFCCWLRTLE